MIHSIGLSDSSPALPWVAAVMLLLMGAVMLYVYRRMHRPPDESDVLERALDMRLKWGGATMVVGGVVMLVVLTNRAL